MQRYFVEPEYWNPPAIRLKDDDAKHILKVMRMQEGDNIICLDNKGTSALCRIEAIQENSVEVHIIKNINDNPELPITTVIAQGLAKGDKLDLVVQKGTELGVSRFCFFAAERSVVKWEPKKAEKKMERLRKIAKEAAEQAGRIFIPEITYFFHFKDILQESKQYEAKILVFEEEAKRNQHLGLKEILKQPQASIFAIIGPEGGISPLEADLCNQEAILSVSLGPRILRTETAPLYLLSVLSYQYELLR
ncbi:16S rRNA (uracil(1498)-N(3))-methyltransferase [Alteribacillus sp. HJP-4]|uniref:16S rRNA (uracil(1498)-N(3))-methyltransferase n=1 Tax=Alteribacillus sp. HJP-4 TaxID=2775394 RepID=UPI0035CD082A